MAASGRTASLAVIERLFQEPHRFDFFQAVRIVEAYARARSPHAAAVGYDAAPQREAVRFRAAPALSFSAAEVIRVAPPRTSQDEQSQRDGGETRPAEMLVSFLGLTGPAGVLPDHYTTLLIERIRANDFSLRDFVDLFHHRTVSLFYRAWEKTNLPAAYDRAHRGGGRPPDAITQSMYGLVGLLSGGPGDTPALPRDSLLYYGGLFVQATRPAVSVERLVADVCGAAGRVLQFQGEWLRLDDEDQSRLPRAQDPDGQYNCLGQNTVLGPRVWDVQGRFRLALGPLRREQFRRYLPSQPALAALGRLVRSLVGPELCFDVQLLLPQAEAPQCRLGVRGDDAPRLGWNVWLVSERAPPGDGVLGDAAFEAA